jgi:chemotaxis protein MotB
MTTLLMTAFVLIYALTAKRVPKEFLAMERGHVITPQLIEQLKKMKNVKTSTENLILTLKNVSPQQEAAIKEAKIIKGMEKELKEYLTSTQLDQVVETETGIDAVLITPRAPLLFAEGQAKLKPEGYQLLDKIIKLLEGVPYYQMRIEGHTDPKPIDYFHRYLYPSNWELSYARAVSIAEYFIRNGIPADRIGISGYGPEKPRYSNDSEEGRSKNRRVEIYISLAKTEPQAQPKK